MKSETKKHERSGFQAVLSTLLTMNDDKIEYLKGMKKSHNKINRNLLVRKLIKFAQINSIYLRTKTHITAKTNSALLQIFYQLAP